MRAPAISIALSILSFSFITLSIGGSIGGCGTPEDHGGGAAMDMSVVVTAMPDLAPIGLKCSTTDNLGDGQACGAGSSCPSGQQAVEIGGACKCFTVCDPMTQSTCPCDRLCNPLKAIGDGGVASGACLPANSAGERCGTDASGAPFGNGSCAQGLVCVASDQAGMFHYCDYLCFGLNSQCPQQTECDPLMDNMGHTVANYCNVLHGTGSKALDMPCTVGVDTCQAGLLCDGTTCKSQCDGPNATCAAATTCTPVTDGTRTVGYVCK